MANQYRSVLSGGASTGGDALPAEVLSGKTFTNDNGPQTGTMTNNGAVSETLSAGQSYTIPEGFHNGNGTVTASDTITVISSGSEDPTPLSLSDLTVGKKYHVIVTGVNTSAQGSDPIITNVTGATYNSLGIVHSQSKNNYIAYSELIEFTPTATTVEMTYSIGQIGYILF